MGSTLIFCIIVKKYSKIPILSRWPFNVFFKIKNVGKIKNVNKRVFYPEIKNVYKRLLQLWILVKTFGNAFGPWNVRIWRPPFLTTPALTSDSAMLTMLCIVRWTSRWASGVISRNDLWGFPCAITSGTTDGERGDTRPSRPTTSLWCSLVLPSSTGRWTTFSDGLSSTDVDDLERPRTPKIRFFCEWWCWWWWRCGQ